MAVLSEALKDFLRQRLTTVDQIDIVLLLMRDPSRAWTAPEVAAAVGTPPESAAMRLFLLASSGLVIFEAAGIPRYRYGSDPATHALLTELADVYTSDRSSIATVIDVPPPDPVRSFADAFKLKK